MENQINIPKQREPNVATDVQATIQPDKTPETKKVVVEKPQVRETISPRDQTKVTKPKEVQKATVTPPKVE